MSDALQTIVVSAVAAAALFTLVRPLLPTRRRVEPPPVTPCKNCASHENH